MLSEMRDAARQQALTTSWNRMFEGMYEAYDSVLFPAALPTHRLYSMWLQPDRNAARCFPAVIIWLTYMKLLYVGETSL